MSVLLPAYEIRDLGEHVCLLPGHGPLTPWQIRVIRDHLEGPDRDRYRIMVAGDPVILTKFPTITETISRLDRAIANIRRFM